MSSLAKFNISFGLEEEHPGVALTCQPCMEVTEAQVSLTSSLSLARGCKEDRGKLWVGGSNN